MANSTDPRVVYPETPVPDDKKSWKYRIVIDYLPLFNSGREDSLTLYSDGRSALDMDYDFIRIEGAVINHYSSPKDYWVSLSQIRSFSEERLTPESD